MCYNKNKIVIMFRHFFSWTNDYDDYASLSYFENWYFLLRYLSGF